MPLIQENNDRIRTTHVGSLARPHDLLDLLDQHSRGDASVEAALNETLTRSVSDVVREQVECGVDVVCDGEYGKTSFNSYIRSRLSGFEPSTEGGAMASARTGMTRERQAFPEYYDAYEGQREGRRPIYEERRPLVCTAPITYTGHADLQRDLDNLRAAAEAAGAEQMFMPAMAPRFPGTNRHYITDEEYSEALADALREEYRAIIEAGVLLQIDDPVFATHYGHSLDPEDERRREMERQVEVLNYALRDLPEDRIRYHTCYSINIGPRVYDAELKDFVDVMLRINAGSYSYEIANPRHAHEWRVWEDVTLPEGKVLIPGVISHSTVLVEHPQWIADQIEAHARLVGRERVIAGADCGFSSVAGYNPEIAPNIVWAKMRAMADGAKIASERLWA